MLKYTKLTIFFIKIHLRRLASYKTDFLIGCGSLVLSTLSGLIFLSLIFSKVPSINGYSLEHILLFYGASITCKGLAHTFSDNLWILARQLITRGELFKYLTRPINPLFYLLAEKFLDPAGMAETATGIGIIIYAIRQSDIQLSALSIAIFMSMIILGGIIYFSIKLIFSSTAFWTTSSHDILETMYSFSNLSKYPLEIYSPILQVVLTWILPFAITGYLPAKFLLTSDLSLFSISLMVTAIFLTIGLTIWKMGLKRFEMAGGQ